uniref:Fumarate hydratase 1-like n=1 Tax=Rhizophora mucronata TaxID=61149 RepID=A0A2P2MCW2_RHIMU
MLNPNCFCLLGSGQRRAGQEIECRSRTTLTIQYLFAFLDFVTKHCNLHVN